MQPDAQTDKYEAENQFTIPEKRGEMEFMKEEVEDLKSCRSLFDKQSIIKPDETKAVKADLDKKSKLSEVENEEDIDDCYSDVEMPMLMESYSDTENSDTSSESSDSTFEEQIVDEQMCIFLSFMREHKFSNIFTKNEEDNESTDDENYIMVGEDDEKDVHTEIAHALRDYNRQEASSSSTSTKADRDRLNIAQNTPSSLNKAKVSNLVRQEALEIRKRSNKSKLSSFTGEERVGPDEKDVIGDRTKPSEDDETTWKDDPNEVREELADRVTKEDRMDMADVAKEEKNKAVMEVIKVQKALSKDHKKRIKRKNAKLHGKIASSQCEHNVYTHFPKSDT